MKSILMEYHYNVRVAKMFDVTMATMFDVTMSL